MTETVADRGAAHDVATERSRILSTLLDRLDDLTARALAAMRAEIPGYETQRDERFLADVYDQIKRHYRANISSFMEERMVTLDDITFVRGAATRRARARFPLEDYLNAFRVGQHVLWEEIVSCAAAGSVGHEAALSLATPVMRYADFASTHAAHAYAEFQQYMLADADRERRDLLEHLLAGEMPTRGPLLAAAQTYGLGPDTSTLVAVAVPAGGEPDADAPQAASAVIARAGLREARTLVVVRQTEIVAVPALGAAASPLALCDRIEELQRRLRTEGMPLAIGVSTTADGVEDLPRAYHEARAALECVADDGGVAALPRLSAFRYLADRADDTARRLIDPRVRELVVEDRARGGVLIATLRAFADADLNLRAAAARLHIHPNTGHYRLRRVQERTGRNPRHITDLLELLMAMALHDAAGTGPDRAQRTTWTA